MRDYIQKIWPPPISPSTISMDGPLELDEIGLSLVLEANGMWRSLAIEWPSVPPPVLGVTPMMDKLDLVWFDGVIDLILSRIMLDG